MTKLPKQVNKTEHHNGYSLLKYTKTLTASFVFTILSGCSVFGVGSPDYGCSGLPEGVQCMSARDVYSATNDGNIPRPLDANGERIEEDDKESKHEHKQKVNGDSVINNYVAPNLPNKPIPIRTPATVMRIWVAPWEDGNGDLITTGYLYTEIEARRWVIGEPTRTGKVDPVFKPLETKK